MQANGAWAGLTPQMGIQVSFYNDLRRLPISITHPIEDNDTLGPGTPQDVQEIVREVDYTVVMNLGVARATVELINQMIAQAEAIIAANKADQERNATQEQDKEKVQ